MLDTPQIFSRVCDMPHTNFSVSYVTHTCSIRLHISTGVSLHGGRAEHIDTRRKNSW